MELKGQKNVELLGSDMWFLNPKLTWIRILENIGIFIKKSKKAVLVKQAWNIEPLFQRQITNFLFREFPYHISTHIKERTTQINFID